MTCARRVGFSKPQCSHFADQAVQRNMVVSCWNWKHSKVQHCALSIPSVQQTKDHIFCMHNAWIKTIVCRHLNLYQKQEETWNVKERFAASCKTGVATFGWHCQHWFSSQQRCTDSWWIIGTVSKSFVLTTQRKSSVFVVGPRTAFSSVFEWWLFGTFPSQGWQLIQLCNSIRIQCLLLGTFLVHHDRTHGWSTNLSTPKLFVQLPGQKQKLCTIGVWLKNRSHAIHKTIWHCAGTLMKATAAHACCLRTQKHCLLQSQCSATAICALLVLSCHWLTACLSTEQPLVSFTPTKKEFHHVPNLLVLTLNSKEWLIHNKLFGIVF